MLNKDFLLKNIKKNLNNIDPSLAMEYLLWLDKQTMYFRDSILRHGYGIQPSDLKRGDIIWVEFGVNIGTELSDIFTKGHYALVWEVDLGNAVVIPLTSRNSYNSPLCLNLGIIKGLGDEGSNSYLKLDAIRSVSKRRISRIANNKRGKIELDEERIRLVKKHIYTFFIEDNYKIYSSNLEILNYIAFHVENGWFCFIFLECTFWDIYTKDINNGCDIMKRKDNKRKNKDFNSVIFGFSIFSFVLTVLLVLGIVGYPIIVGLSNLFVAVYYFILIIAVILTLGLLLLKEDFRNLFSKESLGWITNLNENSEVIISKMVDLVPYFSIVTLILTMLSLALLLVNKKEKPSKSKIIILIVISSITIIAMVLAITGVLN